MEPGAQWLSSRLTEASWISPALSFQEPRMTMCVGAADPNSSSYTYTESKHPCALGLSPAFC